MKKKEDISRAEAWAKDVRPALSERATLLQREIEKRQEAIKSAPEGTLRVIPHGKSCQFYHRTEAQDTSGTYIKKKNIKLAEALAQKAYDKKFIEVAAKELQLIDKYLSEIEPNAIRRIYDSTHKYRKLLISPVTEDDETFIKRWKDVIYEPGYFKEGLPIYFTAKEEKVRSKIEVNIANMLNHYNIPYRYEYPIVLGNSERRPDFFCLNIRKEIIWEHFGLMEHADYAVSNVAKINKYMENGYMPGNNLIMTFETAENPLSTVLIKELIETYLV